VSSPSRRQLIGILGLSVATMGNDRRRVVSYPPRPFGTATFKVTG
jgi:hypothetical protein